MSTLIKNELKMNITFKTETTLLSTRNQKNKVNQQKTNGFIVDDVLIGFIVDDVLIG